MIFDKFWQIERYQRKLERDALAEIDTAVKNKTVPLESLDKFYDLNDQPHCCARRTAPICP